MAAIITKHSPGNMAKAVRMAQLAGLGRPRSTAGMGGGLGFDWGELAQRGVDIVESRWGTQRGTIITRLPDGSIVQQKQAAGYPVATAPPIMATGSAYASEGFGTGVSTGMIVMIAAGVVVLMVVMSGRRR